MITEGDEPQGADLAALQARRADLAAFAPAEDRAIAARLARLFLRFPVTATKGSPEQVAAYVVDLKRFPLWAIEGGIAAIISGQAMKEVAFAPSSLEVQKAVRKVLEPFQTEFAMIGNVLNATVIKRVELTAEDRARIVGDWKKRGLAKDEDAA